MSAVLLIMVTQYFINNYTTENCFVGCRSQFLTDPFLPSPDVLLSEWRRIQHDGLPDHMVIVIDSNSKLVLVSLIQSIRSFTVLGARNKLPLCSETMTAIFFMWCVDVKAYSLGCCTCKLGAQLGYGWFTEVDGGSTSSLEITTVCYFKMGSLMQCYGD